MFGFWPSGKIGFPMTFDSEVIKTKEEQERKIDFL